MKETMLAGLPDRLPVRDLGFAFVQVLHLEAQQVARAGEAETGAGGLVAEDGYSKSAVEEAAGQVVLPQFPKDLRRQESGPDLGVALVPGKQKVAGKHSAVIELRQ